MGSKKARKRTIGVFIAQLDDAYQAAVWRGIEKRASSLDIGLVSFLGRRVKAPSPSEAACNFLYSLAEKTNVDGMLIMTSAIATFLDPSEVADFFRSHSSLPLVSIGTIVPGAPSVTVDGSQGVAELVRHLVRRHGAKRFALIGGPPGHPEGEERESAFKLALAEEGVSFDDGLAISGSFLRESGAEAARKLLSAGKKIDALFCMNDGMAIGAINVLRSAGLRVPGDLAVVGFDGIEESLYLTPPLTTVVQPLQELGISAVDSLNDLFEGRTPENKVLSCVPVFRQSCGCLPALGYDPELGEMPAHSSAEDRVLIANLARLAEGRDTDGFLRDLDAALTVSTLEGNGLEKWHDYLSVVRRKAFPMEAHSPLIEFARVFLGETESRLQAARRVAAETRLAILRAISSSLAGAFEMPVMLDRLKAGLGRLGIEWGYLVLFDGEGIKPGDGWLAMSLRGGIADFPSGRGAFRIRRLLPSAAGASWKGSHWVLEPLVFENEILGYLMLPGGADEPAVYDTLSDQLASALKGTLLLNQIHTHELRLEAEVARRTSELVRINSELTKEVHRRMKLENEVSQISNRTMQRIGQDLHDDLCQHLAGIAMLASVLRNGLSSEDEGIRSSIDRITSLLSDSILRAKQISRGLYPTGLEEHGLAAAVEELVEAARRKYPVQVDFFAAPDFYLPDTDKALQVYRIIQEALSNALKHSGSDKIEVRLYRRAVSSEEGRNPSGRRSRSARRLLIAEVCDFGSGIPSSIKGNGMGMRIMRYRAETSGIELRIESLDPGTRISCRVTDAKRGNT